MVRAMEIMGVVTNTPLEVAASFGVAAFGALAPFQLFLKHHRHRVLLITTCFVGIIIAMVGIAVGSTLCLVAGLAIIFIAMVTGLVILATEPIPPGAIRERVPDVLKRRRKGLIYMVGMALLVAAGAALGLLAGGSAGSSPSSTVIDGKYHVSGTCANGSCTLNECEDRAPCGTQNKGRLREGTALDIVCQAEGEAAEAPNGRKSDIWDRLSSGLYVSDLFVSGTKVDVFTSSLPHCTGT